MKVGLWLCWRGYLLKSPASPDTNLDNHVRCRSSIIPDNNAVTLHHLVQGGNECIPLLHLTGALLRAPTSGHAAIDITFLGTKRRAVLREKGKFNVRNNFV